MHPINPRAKRYNKTVFRDSAAVSEMMEVTHIAVQRLHDKQYSEELVELSIHAQPWMEDQDMPKLIRGQWLKPVPLKRLTGEYFAYLRLDVMDPGPSISHEDVRPSHNTMLLEHLHKAVNQLPCAPCGYYTHYRIIVLVPTQDWDDPASQQRWVPAVISDASFDKGGWGSRIHLEMTLVADMDRMNRKFGPPSFGF